MILFLTEGFKEEKYLVKQHCQVPIQQQFIIKDEI